MGTQASLHDSLDLKAEFKKVFSDKIYRKLEIMLGAHGAQSLRAEGLTRFMERMKMYPQHLRKDDLMNCTASECFLLQLESIENEDSIHDPHMFVRHLMELYIDVLCVPRDSPSR